jgi:type IV pilus assembly protein PilV
MQLSQRISPRARQAGFNLLEVLVSVLIVTVGLLGLAGVQVVAQRAEQESYQRAQAMILMSDIVDRINANRKVAVCYAITPSAGTTFLGTTPAGTGTKYNVGGFTCPSMATNPNAVSRAGTDIAFIDSMLLGASETMGGGKVGAMIGARACIGFDAGSQSYTIAVAWQGNSATFSPATWTTAPNVAKNCATGEYGAETQRRVVWTTLIIANLS